MMEARAPTWRERIAAARERGRFTDSDCHDAGGWMTCAVGEHHAAMPDVVVYQRTDRTDLGLMNAPAPADDMLRHLGGWVTCASFGFAGAVTSNRIDDAERLLDLIEDRVLQLKRAAHGA